jgi:hypothetical protein
MQRGQHLTARLQQQGFGDFQLQPFRRQAALLQRIHHDRQQIAGAKLRRRQIDRNANVVEPDRGVPAGAPEHQPADRIDQAGLFGHRNEFGRRVCCGPRSLATGQEYRCLLCRRAWISISIKR